MMLPPYLGYLHGSKAKMDKLETSLVKKAKRKDETTNL